ncbi:transposase InsO family protein [Bradyrhizobium sp. USDA 4341]
MTYMFDMRCQGNGIEHQLTMIRHPWTNGQVERMNGTIKEATVQATITIETINSKHTLPTSSTLRSAVEDPEGRHALRIHLQMLDFPARTIQT